MKGNRGMHVLVCMIIQEVVGICVWIGDKYLRKDGPFCGVLYTPPERFPFSVEFVVTLLNVPAVKHTACWCQALLSSAECASHIIYAVYRVFSLSFTEEGSSWLPKHLKKF